MIDFAIIGAQKSGTTALAQFLAQHPAIAMTHPKEAHIFDAEDFDPATIEAKYSTFFEHASEEQLRGDATPIYIFWQDVLAALSAHNRNLKVIILLRDPVDRAISHYEMEMARGNERLPLWRALLSESSRLKNDVEPKAVESATRLHSYRHRGYYSHQLANVYKIFSKEQVLIVPMNRLMREHQQTMQQVFSFLGVDSDVQVAHEVVFSSGDSRNRYPFSRLLLKLCYLLEYRRLRQYLDLR